MSEAIKIDHILDRRREREKRSVIDMLQFILFEKRIALFIIALLLGRAVILYHISPFALAFLATAWFTKQKHLWLIFLFVCGGAFTYSLGHAAFVLLSAILFFTFAKAFLHRAYKKRIFFIVFLSSVMTRVFLFSISNQITPLEWMHLCVEALLTIVLLLIFMQSIPLLVHKTYQPAINSEEMICLIILFASVLTGLIGWTMYGIALENVFSRYIVISLAFVGGAAVGSTVGVVTGLILSLANILNVYEMSLLAFSGLMGGLLQEGRKHGASFGLLIGTVLVGVYGETTTLTITLMESMGAIILFYLTPTSWLITLAKYIPGTSEHTNEEKQYVQKIRDVTAQRVERFSSVFAALSESFIQSTEGKKEQNEQIETDYFLSKVTEKSCQQCFMKERCWQKNFNETYELMDELKEGLLVNEELDATITHRFENYCVKSKKVMEVMAKEVDLLKVNKQLKKQVTESKKIVADQLQGVSEVMDSFAKEMVEERQRHEKQELQIIRAMKQLDIHLEKLEIYQLDKGDIDLTMTVVFYEYHGEGAKLIAPVLTDILREPIVVTEEEISPFPNGVSVLTFSSQRKFQVDTGYALAAKGGGLISGDSHTIMELGKGKFALAISDGMGNGLRAREESEETLRLLESILQSGISEQVAIKSINSILALRTTDEIFATLDLAMINLHNATLRFLKIGSSPSFIKRGKEVIQLTGNNLPIGIIEHVELDTIRTTLKAGDMLIMMSDGLYDGPKHVVQHDKWLERKIREMKTEEPQEIADLLIEEVVRGDFGVIHDDMTVIVAKITHAQPKWATFSVTEPYAT